MKNKEKKQTNKALTIAKALIATSNSRNIPIDHLKLQKLLYFAQAISLVRNSRPLFAGKMYAWKHGPVVDTVWNEYQGNGRSHLSMDDSFDITSLKLSKKDMKVIEDTIEKMKKYSGVEMREITHSHKPWKDVYEEGKNKVIENQSICEYYKKILV